MPKNSHMNSNVPTYKSNYSSGSRGDSATARNLSGNHYGNRIRPTKGRGTKTTRIPKHL